MLTAWSGASPPRCAPGWMPFKAALLTRFDEAYALQLFEKYAQAFPAAYTEDFQADAAALDVSFLEALEKEPLRLHLDIYRPDPRRKEKFFLKIFRGQDAIPISDLLPMLENMGLKVIAERPYELEFPGRKRGWIQDLELIMQATPAIRRRGAGPRDQECVHRRMDRPHGQRQLQSADAGGRHSVAHGDRAARLLPLPAADRPALQSGLYRAGAGQPRADLLAAGGPVQQRDSIRSCRCRCGRSPWRVWAETFSRRWRM